MHYITSMYYSEVHYCTTELAYHSALNCTEMHCTTLQCRVPPVRLGGQVVAGLILQRWTNEEDFSFARGSIFRKGFNPNSYCSPELPRVASPPHSDILGSYLHKRLILVSCSVSVVAIQ